VLDALRRLWHYPMSRSQVWLALIAFLVAVFLLSGMDARAPLLVIGFFILIGVIPYLVQRFLGRPK
jgi:hypothetical protein